MCTHKQIHTTVAKPPADKHLTWGESREALHHSRQRVNQILGRLLWSEEEEAEEKGAKSAPLNPPHTPDVVVKQPLRSTLPSLSSAYGNLLPASQWE